MGWVRDANLGIRFVPELAALAVLSWWGAETGTAWWERGALAVGAAGAAAIAWGLFVSPRAKVRTGPWLPLAVETVVFGCAVAALLHLGHPVPAVTFAGVAIASRGIKGAFDLRTG